MALLQKEGPAPDGGPGQGQNKGKTSKIHLKSCETNVKCYVENFCKAGLVCLPANSNSKYPDGISWRQYKSPLDYEAFKAIRKVEHDGLCLITGAVSNNLETIDFDKKVDEEQFNALLKAYKSHVDAEKPGLLDRLPAEKTQSGGRHIFFRCPEAEIPSNQKLARLDKETCVIETRGEGGLVVCQPTTGYSPTKNDILNVPVITPNEREILLKAAVKLNQYIDPGKIITGKQALSNGDLKPGDDFNNRGKILPILEKCGWTIQGTHEDYLHLTRPGKKHGVSASLIDGRILHVFSTSTPFESEQAYSPFAVYAVLKHDGDHQAAARELARQGYGNKHTSITQTVWGAPQPISNALPSVPEFDPLLLPEAFETWLSDIAERTQCPLDYLAVGAMTALSGLIGRKATIQPKEMDDWIVVPNLWGAVVGPPGVMKTPALAEAKKPLSQYESRAQEQYHEALKLFEEDKQIFQAVKTERDKEIKAAHKNGNDPRVVFLNYPEPEPPLRKRYTVNDFTVESLIEIMHHNPLGVFAFRDELIGLLKNLEKEGQEHARAFYLEAWEGKSGFSVDRIGRGHTHIPHACLSILGGIQPGRLQSYILDAVRGGQGDDGLLQRFQLFVWPDISKKWRDVDRAPDIQAQQVAFNVFDALDKREQQETPFRLDAKALKLFQEWRPELEHKIRAEDEHPAFEAHLSKYRSLVPSLALLLALADNPVLESEIPLNAMEKAAAWADYLEEHARRIYASVTQGAGMMAEALAKKIKSGDIKDGQTVRSIHRNGWSRLSKPDQVFDGLYYLEELDWLRVIKEGTRGRAKYIIHLNPNLKK